MAKKDVENFLIAGGSNDDIRIKYGDIDIKEDFVAMANEDGYDFTLEDLDAVLNEAGDSFESNGNPRKKDIWWK